MQGWMLRLYENSMVHQKLPKPDRVLASGFLMIRQRKFLRLQISRRSWNKARLRDRHQKMPYPMAWLKGRISFVRCEAVKTISSPFLLYLRRTEATCQLIY
jgi:hypothetical protein